MEEILKAELVKRLFFYVVSLINIVIGEEH